MWKLAAVSLLIGLGATLVGFTSVAGLSGFAQLLAFVFLSLSGIFLILGFPGLRDTL